MVFLYANAVQIISLGGYSFNEAANRDPAVLVLLPGRSVRLDLQ
jgi:hypothetical protein